MRLSLVDAFMMTLNLGISALFAYSAWSPDWLTKRWTPARIIYDSRGDLAVRCFFVLAALGLLGLAAIQWLRAGETSGVRSESNVSRMLGIGNDELLPNQ